MLYTPETTVGSLGAHSGQGQDAGTKVRPVYLHPGGFVCTAGELGVEEDLEE